MTDVVVSVVRYPTAPGAIRGERFDVRTRNGRIINYLIYPEAEVSIALVERDFREEGVGGPWKQKLLETALRRETVLDALQHHGGDINVDEALLHAQGDVADLLLAHGARATARTPEGHSALCTAMAQHERSWKVLCAAGAPLHCPPTAEQREWTPR